MVCPVFSLALTFLTVTAEPFLRGVQAKMAKRAESEDDASKIAEYAAKKKEGAERKAERFIL